VHCHRRPPDVRQPTKISLTIACTIGKDQEEVYLGMTLDSLQEDLDVDAISEGQRFSCTLIIISKNTNTAVRLQINYTSTSADSSN
jgi:hypothetical protein